MNEFITDAEGILLGSVHPMDNCAGESCVIHNPSDHHMRAWTLNWRDDRRLFERICPHGIGHPDPDQFEFWNRMAAQQTIEIAKWMTRQDPDKLTKMASWEMPGNPWEGMSVHGCDGCCRP